MKYDRTSGISQGTSDCIGSGFGDGVGNGMDTGMGDGIRRDTTGFDTYGGFVSKGSTDC